MESKEIIISHVRPDDFAVQTNEEHQLGVARLAGEFASAFGMKDYGVLLGLLHDKGKEQDDFQTYIKKMSGLCPELIVRNHPNHAYVGALLAKKLYPPFTPFLAYPIMGHHAGLYDYDEYETILKEKTIPSEVTDSQLSINLAPPVFNASPQRYEMNHLIRLLFSCLVDADYLDTEHFMKEEQSQLRGGKPSLAALKPLLDAYLEELSRKPTTPVNLIRNEVQQACLDAVEGEPGFYSLTVPTGGGKTLSSIVWAVNHALKYGKRRIIIAIPYTSIIVQTAQVLRDIFGAENVLEHHSNISFEVLADFQGENATNASMQMKLATENWDYPIVVTTNVQLFESLYASRPSQCRKLHNICNSVLILDEVQTLPTDYLQPIINALKTYQRQLGVSVLFTTASQPVLVGKHRGCNPSVKLEGIDKVTEIIPADFRLHERLRRVNLHFDDVVSSYDDMARRISQFDRVLCVVNTRRDAAEIYNRLPKVDGELTIHLSRMMCPEHVAETIVKLKEALRDVGQKVIRVISTQLIEAGVDIDFPVVFRQEAGLDSVLQAAGRCNREGSIPLGDTYVFRLEKPLPPGFMSRTNSARIDMMDAVEDKFSPEAMATYFGKLYGKVSTFDKSRMAERLEASTDFLFRTASEEFHLIDDNATSVIVNWRNGMDFVERLKEEGPSYSLMKRLAQYSVNVRQNDLKLLMQAGALEEVLENIYAVSSPSFYDEHVGLVTTNQWIEETYIL